MREKMDRDRWQTIDGVFTAVLEVPASERVAFLEQRCTGDPELLKEVHSLLDAAGRSAEMFDEQRRNTVNSLFESILARVRSDAEGPREDLSGSRLGVWRLERRIARGGHATVYLAQRDDGLFEQRAAVKVLRRGLDTGDLLRRFEAERQILSTLDSPCLARLLDAGSLEDGRPYLVMEHVDGLPIDEHCRRNRCTAVQRVRLLIQTARAVDRAHRHLVVHRDLKASNVFVTEGGEVRLLDFGIAKLLDPDSIGVAAVHTRVNHQPLTPECASPEQLKGDAVTVASDVYQLGLLLYELLTGVPAFGASPDSGPLERLERDPSPPGKAASQAAAATGCGVAPGRISADLDVIVLKALRRVPDERYKSAADLAADLENYLAGRPVSARAPTLRYRFGKLVRRNPWLAPASVLGVVLVLGYMATLQVHSRQLAEERDLAQRSEALLVDLLRSADPYGPEDRAGGADITMTEILDRAVGRIGAELEGQPALQASLYDTIAGLYNNLDELDESLAVREREWELVRELHGARSPQAVEIMLAMGSLHGQLGDDARARSLMQDAWEMARQIGPQNTVLVARTNIFLGMRHTAEGDPARAVELLERGVETLRREAAAGEDLIMGLRNLSTTQTRLGKLERALAAASEALERAGTVYANDSVTRAIIAADVASIHSQRREFAAAERGFEAALAVLEKKLGATHRVTVAVTNNYAFMYSHMGDYARAELLHRRVLEGKLARGGDEAPSALAESYQNLATTLLRLGRTEEALPLFAQAHEAYLARASPDNFRIALPLLSLASAELSLRRPEAAEATASSARDHLVRTLPEDHFIRAVGDCLLGRALEAQGKHSAAQPLLDAAWRLIDGNASVPPAYGELCSPDWSG